MSHLTRGAWIEISAGVNRTVNVAVSHLTRGAWIEIFPFRVNNRLFHSRTSHEVRGLKLLFMVVYLRILKRSHLTRGAWIEMLLVLLPRLCLQVAPHTRCVD